MSDDVSLEDLLANMLDRIEALERGQAGPGGAATGEVDRESTRPNLRTQGGASSIQPMPSPYVEPEDFGHFNCPGCKFCTGSN
jgi:hypothetical protein